MSLEYLGDEFDLHTGGVDLIFPHHEDEIAQSDGAAGHRVVRRWCHGQHLLAEGRKMSKSSQNFYDLRDLAKRDHTEPLAFRLLCLQTRYRAQFNFTWDALRGAERALERWRRLMNEWIGAPTQGGTEPYEERFLLALNNDLDTPTMLALLSEVTSAQNLAPGDKAALLAKWDAVLGLDLTRAAPEKPLPAGAAGLIEERERARAAKDFARSDLLRTELRALGVEVEDTPNGPKPHVL